MRTLLSPLSSFTVYTVVMSHRYAGDPPTSLNHLVCLLPSAQADIHLPKVKEKKKKVIINYSIQ